MKSAFRSPIFLLLTLGFLSCGREHEPQPADNRSLETQKGWALEQRAFQFAERSPDSAFSYFSKARKHYEKAADSARVVYVLLNMASIQYQYNDFGEMQSSMVDALKFLDRESVKSYQPIIHNNLGIAYCQLEDFPRAIENYEKTLALSESPVHQATAKNNIAYVYMNKRDYDKAFRILDELYQSANIDDSLSVKARVADNLGYCAFKLGKTNARILADEAMAIRKQIGDDFGLITSKLHLGEMLLKSDKTAALSHVADAERLAAKTNSPDDQLLALQFLSANSDPVRSRAYTEKYFRISDSIQSVRRKARNYFAEVKYNYKVERDEKLKLQANEAKLKLEQSQLKNSRLSWLLAAVCILFTSGMIIYIIVKRNRRIRWKASYDAEVRIANRLHDELANDLHQTIVFTEANDVSQPEHRNKLLDNLDLIYRRARGISREHAGVGDDDFAGKLKDLISYYGSPGQNVLAKGIGDVDWTQLTQQQRVAVHRAVQELLVNMKKHSQCTIAVLQFSVENKRLTIAYSDNGVGGTAASHPANGLSIMENRIRDLSGTITFGNSGKGFRVKIEFPI